MLATNPICNELYEYGFDGRQNVFEYWTENKEDILAYLASTRPDILEEPYFLRDFEAKVRWRSHIGIMLTFETYRVLRRRKNNEVLDFREIQIKQGSKYYSFNDFGELFPLEENLISGKTDLRGISILRLDIERVTLANLDLMYASFDSTTFSHVCFGNCRLDYARFCRGVLKECTINSKCNFDYVDLSDTFLNAKINNDFVEPLFTVLKKQHVIGLFSGFNRRWRAYSEVSGTSFFERCKSESVALKMTKQQKLIEEAYALKGKNIFKQMMFLILLPIIKQPQTLRASMSRERHSRPAFEIPQIWN